MPLPKPDWAKTIPRSRRECKFCHHLYASHIGNICIRVVQRANPRIECDCKGFCNTQEDLDKALKKQKLANILKQAQVIEVEDVSTIDFGVELIAQRVARPS